VVNLDEMTLEEIETMYDDLAAIDEDEAQQDERD
jgi:hypothetical protein